MSKSIATLAKDTAREAQLREVIAREGIISLLQKCITEGADQHGVQTLTGIIGRALQEASFNIVPRVDDEDSRIVLENVDRIEAMTELVTTLFRQCPPEEQAWCIGLALSDGSLV